MALRTGTQRIVSVLVADIVGSTGIGERLGPERSKFLFDEVVALMVREVRRFDGTVAQLTGDGILALFGAPVGHEDDAERAVRAALALQAAIEDYAEEVRDAYAIELAVRVAVNTGPVVVADGDGEDRYNALGDTVNVAARLQTVGPEHGGVVIGVETARQVQAAFELESLGDVGLRGLARPVRVSRVVGERGVAQVRQGVPLVGRERELAVLEEACASLVDGRGAIVTVTGEPGIGKTRLFFETRRRVSDRIRFLEGRATAYAESFPYWPVRDLLRDWLAVCSDAPEARLRLELKSALSGLLGPDAAGPGGAYPFLARVLGVPLEPEPGRALRELSREALQHRTFSAVGEVVRALAEAQPLAVVLDDVQWADSSTLELLEELLVLTEEVQLGIILIYRSDRDQPSWRLGERARQLYPHRHREIELRPLTDEASLALVHALAEERLPPALADRLAERAGGNPFFIEEAVQDLIERGALRDQNGGRVEGGDEVARVVPTAVQGALQARLDRLPARTREVVSVASAVGRGFTLPLLERLLPREQVVRALSELMRLDLVVEVGRRPAPEYRFRHGLVQEVAYRSLLEPARRSLHRRIGEALEALHGESRAEVHGVLAHHFAEADEPEAAARYLLAAGDAARALYADREAVALYHRARAFLRRLGDSEQERETLFKIALAHHLAFDYERAAEAYDAAFNCDVDESQPGERPPARLDLSIARPDSFAPGDSYRIASSIVIEQLFRGLLRIDQRLNVVPELAQNMTVSPDGLTYLFMLREDACWSDGHPVTAEDFVYAWRQLREEGHITAFLLDDIEDAEALDDRTLEVRLREPRNYFPYVLASHWAYPWPRHRVEELGAGWRRPESLVGNGPFALQSLDGGTAVLSASPGWPRRSGNVGEVHVEFRDSEEPAEAWTSGRYDMALGWGIVAVDAPDTIVEQTLQLATTFLAFNSRNELVADARLRLAIAHAIDRRTLVEASGRSDLPAERGGTIPPGMPGHSDSVAPAYDPDTARRLLAEAGYPKGEGLPEIVLVSSQGRGASGLVEQLAAIGVRARIVDWTPTSDTPRRPSRHRRGFNVAARTHGWLGSWQADYPDPDGLFLGLLHWDMPMLRDEESMAVAEHARASRNRDERLRLYREFERLWIGQKASLVPLAYERQTILRRPHVQCPPMGAVGTFHLDRAVVDVP